MSLLNDALKRAKQGNDGDQPPVVPLQPVDYGTRSNPFLRMILIVLTIGALSFSVWFFGKWWQGREGTVREANPTAANAVAVVEAPAVVEPAPVKSRIKISTNVVVRPVFVSPPRREAADAALAQTNFSAGASAKSSATNVGAMPAPAPSPAIAGELRLLSIIFRRDKPAAVINGEMLHVGEEIRGARVIDIERNSVTLKRGGTNVVLQLPRL